MAIFLDDADYRQFVYFLGDVVEGFGIECWNYCVMPNHYHATLQPRQSNLSEAIRRLNSLYAQWWNRRHGRVGHVFQGRFKDQIVDRTSYLLVLSRYVATNPVRAGLVERPEQWRWSSYGATIGVASTPSFLAASATLRLFGEGPEAVLQARFAQSVAGPPDDPAVVDRIRSSERVLGDRAFKNSLGDLLRPLPAI
jgi:putative transposase